MRNSVFPSVHNSFNEVEDQTQDESSSHYTYPTTTIESLSDSFPYPTEEDDHCESPLEAYQHIAPLLQELASLLEKTPKTLSLYDAYYCNGSVKERLQSLGFPTVHHEKQDCYEVWKTGDGLPDFDVLVTNPPYSSNHMERMMQFVTAKTTSAPRTSPSATMAWFMLAPQFLHKKDCYVQSLDQGYRSPITPFYLVPKNRYIYEPPKGFREKKESGTHKKSSPFISMWYIWAGTAERTNKLIQFFYKQTKSTKNRSIMAECELARSKSALRDLRRKPNTGGNAK